MPVIAPNEIADIEDKETRSTLHQLLHERSALAYAFSWERLLAAVWEANHGSVYLTRTECAQLLVRCIAAADDKKEREVKDSLNEQILNIFTENGIEKTMRHVDPLGNQSDYIILSSSSSSFNKEKALQWAVKHGIPAETFTAMFEENTKKTPYVTISVRGVKEKEDVA